MTFYDEQLNEILAYYEGLNDMFKHELLSSPEGTLIFQKNRGSTQFLQMTRNKGKCVRRGINKDTALIKSLARKEFNTKAYEILSGSVDSLNAAINGLKRLDSEKILKSMTKAYSLLPEEYFFDRNKLLIGAGLDDDLLVKIQRHEEWWKKPYKEYWGYPEHKTRRSSRGQFMRSISEILIAEALYKYSIPFHYEEELEVDGKTYAPDFTFEGWDYNKFYLEYFGRMSDAKYAKKNIIKLDDYYDIGLVPGGNLIVVFNSKGIMNAKVIEEIIKNEVIPRL